MKIRKLHKDTASIAFAGLQITDPRVSVFVVDDAMDLFEGGEHDLLFESTIAEYKHADSKRVYVTKEGKGIEMVDFSGFHANRIVALIPEKTWNEMPLVEPFVEAMLSGKKSEAWIISETGSYEQ